MSLINQGQPAEKPYEYQEYPKWIGDKLVQNADEEEALLAAQKPAQEQAEQTESQDEPTGDEPALLGADTAADREALIATAKAKGIAVRSNWTDATIRAKIEAAQ